MWLPDQVFKTVIQSTPLISIDLVVRNEKNEVLLGKRLNAPAKGFWFVPGGRIQKNETLDNAFKRLINEELGLNLDIKRLETKFLGIYEHFYDENVFDELISTHYIVLGYELKINENFLQHTPKLQHKDFIFISDQKLIANESVHLYTKKFFDIN